MIRITRLTDYGIVLLSRFADAGEEVRLSAPDLAAWSGLPAPTVSKICKALTRQGLLVSHRGTQGGYALGRPADEVTIADVIDALEGPIALTDCASETDGACDIEPTCPVRSNWRRITDAVRQALAAIPLSEMARPHLVPPVLTPAEDATAAIAAPPKGARR